MTAGCRAVEDTEAVGKHHSLPEAGRLSFGVTPPLSLHYLAYFLSLITVGFVLWQQVLDSTITLSDAEDSHMSRQRLDPRCDCSTP